MANFRCILSLGVYPLSKFEVKKDVQEMERAANSDTETDSSIISEDVLNSTYPVKPRKTPRGPIIPIKSASLKASHVEPTTPDCDGISVEQALTFLDVISRSESSLKAVEHERESFEIQALVRLHHFILLTLLFSGVISCNYYLFSKSKSYRCRIDERSKSFHAIKKEQSNYMKAMQGFNSQALRLQMSLKRQNMMLFDVYTVLQRRQKASDSILADAASLQAVIENQRRPESISSPSCHVATLNVTDVGQAETATLRITLPRSKEEIVLYKGQCVRTPMGDAFVLCIIPGLEKVVLQLSFGKMYVTVRQMVVWGREKRLNQLDELLTVDSLRQKWTSLHTTGGLIVPSEVRNAIQALAGQGEDEPATDGDEDSANDDSNLQDNILDDSSSSSIINMKGNLNILGECSEQSAQATHIVHASSACNGGSNGVFSSTVRCATDNNTPWGECTFPLKGYPPDAPSSSSTSSPSASASSSTAVPLSRQALKNILSLQGMEDCQDLTASSALPYIFTPPGTANNGLHVCIFI